MTAALTKTKTKVNQQETARVATSVASKAGLGIMTGAAALVGIWAVACFAAAVVSNGPLAMIKGWFAALLG